MHAVLEHSLIKKFMPEIALIATLSKSHLVLVATR